MQAIDARLSHKITNMGFVCSCLVVIIHCGAGNDGSPLSQLLRGVLTNGLCLVAVPFFFTASGYFAAAQEGSVLFSRLRTLGIPYLFWCLLFFAFGSVLCMGADAMHRRAFGTTNLIHDGLWLRVVGFDLTHKMLCVQFWYVRSLLLFFVLLSMIRVLIKRFNWFWLLGLYFVVVIASIMEYEHPGSRLLYFFSEGFSLRGLFFFSLGYWLRSFPYECLLNPHYLIGLVGIIMLASHLHRPMSFLPVLYTPLLLVGLWSLMPTSGWPGWITAQSFPIFCVHLFIIQLSPPFDDICPVGGAYIMQITYVITISFAVALILRRCFGRSLVLWGGALNVG